MWESGLVLFFYIWMPIFPKNSYWKDCSPHNIILPPMCYTDHINIDLFLGSLFCSIHLCALFFFFFLVPLLNCFDYHNFLIWSEVREYDTFSFVFFSHCFGFSGSFVSLYKFKNFVPALWKMTFNRDFTESVDYFQQYGHFNSINFSNPWVDYIFPFICIFFNFF